jgi:beta-glucosidase
VPTRHDEFWWATGIEDTFIAQESPTARRLDEYELQQHYQHWRQDLELAADAGFRMIRYGIPWYRVEPEPGRFDWSFTDQVLPYLTELQLEPIVDLVHYGTPLWLEGQFANPDYPARVAAYAGAFAHRYRDLARCYTPLNEPFVNADLCGFEGRWPPHRTGDRGFVTIISGISRGIVATIQALRTARPDAIIVHVEAAIIRSTGEPALAERVRLDSQRQHAALDLVLGRVDSSHVLYPYLRQGRMTDEDLTWYRDNHVQIDVLGLNYYPDACVQRWYSDPGGGMRSETVWGGGEYLARAVREHHQRYQLPILISETAVNERSAERYAPGLASTGPPAARSEFRARWLDEVVETVRSLRSGRVPVIGLTWWPLLDAVGWDYREGTGPVEDYLEPAGLIRLRPDGAGMLRREALPVFHRMRQAISGPSGPET